MKNGVPQARHAVSPGPQPRQRRGGSRSSRKSTRPIRCSPTGPEARRLRPLRPPRPSRHGRRWPGIPASAASFDLGSMSATSSRTCSAWAASAARRRRGASAARICATTWKSRWRRPSPAPEPCCAFRPRSPARPVRAPVRSRARSRRPAEPAMAAAACAPAGLLHASSAPAPPARARGQVIEDPCRACTGRVARARSATLSVNIPAGVEDGTRIRLVGEGEAGGARRTLGRPLHLPVDAAATQFFQREGADLLLPGARSPWCTASARRQLSRCRRSTASARA